MPGVLNFAGASFFGIGAYTSAVLNAHTGVPHLLVLLIGGLLAALIGSLLLLPVLRTRGHYAALVTIAFALLLKTFLEVNDVLGGPQGMQVKGMKHPRLVVQRQYRDRPDRAVVLHELFRGQPGCCWSPPSSWCAGWSGPGSGSTSTPCGSTRPRRAASGSISRAGRSPRSRSAIFSSASPARCSAWSAGSSRPTITPSRIRSSWCRSCCSGGIGNPWGLVVATVIVVVVPEKLQTIQEYRFLLYALLVIVVLLFRPEGLLPRPVRRYFPGMAAMTLRPSAGGARPHQELRRRGGARPSRSRGRAQRDPRSHRPQRFGQDHLLQRRHRHLRRRQRHASPSTAPTSRARRRRRSTMPAFPAPSSARGCRCRCRSSTTS